MIPQTRHFSDNDVITTITLDSPIPESKTYPFTVKLTADMQTWTEVVFYGNKFINAGVTKVKLNITPFIQMLTYKPTYDDLYNMVGNTAIDNYVIKTVQINLYNDYAAPEYLLGTQYVTAVDIQRYPNVHDRLEVMIGDDVVTQNHNVIQTLIQGNGHVFTPGKITPKDSGDPTGENMLLTPVFPMEPYGRVMIGDIFVGFQCANITDDVYVTYKYQGDDEHSQLIDNIQGTPVHSGYLRLRTINDPDLPVDSVYFEINGDQTKIADIDFAPCSRYYLMWQDRYSGFQCQPFEKGSTYKEQFKYNEIQKANLTRVKTQTDVQPSWEINSGWIDTNVYSIYESIFISRSLVLIDTVDYINYNVIVKDTSYTEKTFRNQNRKMFNLKLNLELAKKQVC